MKEINIAEILKDCPKGTKLYSTYYGNVTLRYVSADNNQIYILDERGNCRVFFENGKAFENGECSLFPSKYQRDWSKFVKPHKPPFCIERVGLLESYFYFDNIYADKVVETKEMYSDSDNHNWGNGNYFNTREQAEYAAEKSKELLFSLRKEAGNE